MKTSLQDRIHEAENDLQGVRELTVRMLNKGAKSATMFLSINKVLRVTRPAYRHRKNKTHTEGLQPLSMGLELRVHIGRPNYLERAFINKNKGSQSIPGEVTFIYPAKRRIKK